MPPPDSNPLETESPTPSEEPTPSENLGLGGDIQVELEAPAPTEPVEQETQSDDSEGTAAAAAEVISGLFQVVGGEADVTEVPWALTKDEKKAFAGALAPVLRKHGMTALPYPEETALAIQTAVIAGPRLMKLKKKRDANRTAGRTPESQEVAVNGHHRGSGQEGHGQVDVVAKTRLAMFEGPKTPTL